VVLVGRRRHASSRLFRLGLALAGWWALMATPLAAQISPGPLAAPHASLEGPTQCTTCHGNRRDAMSGQCAACHKDIGWLMEQGRGFHGSTTVKATACATCHPDHAGKDFDLVKWPDGSARDFDHKRAGWALAQKHAEAACEDCHTAKFQVNPPANLSVRKTGQGYTGLSPRCTACHEDIHRGALKQDCAACHDAGSWKVTPGFDHDTTAYPLTDKHRDVKCDKCHLDPRLSPRSDGRGHLIPVYKPVSFSTCADCHADPHAGALGPKCADCHSTRGFKEIDKNRFDHDRTAYPLRGKHATATCASCHRDFSTPALKKPAFGSCGTCHKDAHNGTATLAGRVVDCAQCHTVNGFTPSTYTTASHASSAYPLEGKHLTVPCGSCHVQSTATTAAATLGSSKVVMRPKFARCTDCHADDHGGQLKATADKGQCSTCHRVTGWTPSTFDSAAHAKTTFALDGRHEAIACTACHGATRTGLPPMTATAALGKAQFRFQLTETECAACHLDPHQGRFAAGGARAQSGGCRACHDTRAFRPSTTDIAVHALFGFPLEGAHRATPCSACHTELTHPSRAAQSTLVRGGGQFGRLTFEAKTDCAGCHETPHGKQFDDWNSRGGCAACHTTEAFVPASRFNHDTEASFPLKGAHEKVACAQCHVRDAALPASAPLRYRPLSGRCESCHGKESP
jgi:hypothetical protein